MKPIYNLLAALAVLSWFNAAAQTKYETVKKTFRITEIYPSTSHARDTALAYVPATKKSGIEVGQVGIVLSTGGKYNNYIQEIGTGFVITVDTSGTFIYVTSNRKALADSQYMLKVGDLVTIDVKVPKIEKKSIFYELDLLGVIFYKRDDSPLYRFEQTIQKNGKKYYDSLVAECLKECKRTYEKFKANPNLDVYYTETITSGRHKGRSIMDIYKDPKQEDILPFLAYAKEYKSSYRGKLYYLTYSLAIWLHNGSLYSSRELLDTLLSCNINSKKFKDIVAENKQDIIDNGYVENWSFVAMDEQGESREKAADSILAITNVVARLVNDDYSLGLHYLAHAQVVQYRSNYKTAIAYCDSGMKYLKPGEYGYYHMQFMIKKGYCYRKLGLIKEATENYDLAAATVRDTNTNIGTNSRNLILGRIYNDKGDAYDAFDDYTKAIQAYKESITSYQADSSYEAITKTADVQSSLADIYKKQGAFADASDIYNELISTYTQLNDVKSRAKTYDNLGYVQFKQGKYREAIKNHRSAEKTFSALKIYNKAGFSFSQIGQAYWNLGNYDSAIICHNLAIKNAKWGDSPSDEAYSWGKLGSLYSLVGDKNKALNAYDSSLHCYELAEDSSGLITNSYDVGSVYEKDGQYQKAFGYYNKAHAINLKRNDKSELANSYFKMAYAAYNYDTAVAKKNYLSCYNIAKELGDKTNILYSSLNLGILAVRQYDYNLSQKYFDEGLALAIDQKSKTDEAWAYTKIADGATQKLEYDKAFELYSKALYIYDSLGEKSQVPWLYSSLGYSVECKGDFAGSLKYFEKMKEMGVELKNQAYVASALGSMSFVYSLFGDHKKALSCVDSALQIFKELNNTWQIANTYGTMGSVYSGMGDFHKAITYHLMSDSLYKIEKDDISRGTAQNNIGVVYFFQADYDKSLSYFMESDRLGSLQNTLNESLLVTRQNIGEIYLAKKNYVLATKYLSEVYKVSLEKKMKRMIGGSSLLLGKVAFENNKLQEALNYFKEAREMSLQTNESDRLIESELFLGKAYSQLKDDQATIFLRSSVALAQKTSSKYLWEALYELGLSYYTQNNFDSATVFFKEAVTDIEETSSKLFGGAEAKKVYTADFRKVDLYNKLVASLAKLKKADEALFYADKSNNQALKEKMEQSGIITSDQNKSEALKKGNELLQKQTAIDQAIAKEKAKPEKEQNKELIASLEGVKKVAEEDYLNFINDLVKKYPDLNSYFSKTDPSQFRNFIDFIPDSTIVILYVLNDKQLFIFTVTNQETGIKVVDLPLDLNAEATRFLSILKNPENATGTGAITVRATIKDKNVIKGDFKKDATLLYSLLITPIEDQLKDKKTLCIIPNSKLSSIPFSTLGYLDNTNQFHFLIENYKLYYTNKMEIFSKPYKAQNIEQSFVAFGNPDKSLPGATQEIVDIQEIFPSATVYLEENATEEKAKDAIKNFSFVHFATHGILDGEDFSKSYLLFNADGTNDGKLSIAEVNGLIKKETSMVFLSACDMAVSQETVKGWYISPINAFLNNRVTTGVGPLWQVPDEATRFLLREFYRNLKYLKMTRTEALRHAQAELSKNPKYSHPYFWGAFVLYGEWR
jgi:CHAT domain-containing protein